MYSILQELLFLFLFYNTLIRVRENREYMMCLMSILTFKRCKSVSLHLPWNCINSAHHTVFISARVSNIDRDLINLLKYLLHFWRLSFHHAHYGTSKESFRICYEHINNDTNEIYLWYNTVWADIWYKYCISRS